jgi:acetyl esterase
VRLIDKSLVAATRFLATRLLSRADTEAMALCSARDLSFPGAAGALPARLYEPDPAAPAGPALIYFHGGGFFSCGIDTHDGLCRRLAAAAGVRILACGYRLAPEHPFPAQQGDAAAAARWAVEHHAELGLDPTRLGLAGDSAGAHLAAWAGTSLCRSGVQPALYLLIYPFLTLDDGWNGALARSGVAFVSRQMGSPSAEAVALQPEASAWARRTLIVSGKSDPVRWQGARLEQTLCDVGIPVEALDLAGVWHASLNFAHRSFVARRAIAEIGEATAALLSRAVMVHS